MVMSHRLGFHMCATYDVFHDADDVRRRIGYMPENNPLHMDMRVKEYLKFRARLKGLSIGKTHDYSFGCSTSRRTSAADLSSRSPS